MTKTNKVETYTSSTKMMISPCPKPGSGAEKGTMDYREIVVNQKKRMKYISGQMAWACNLSVNTHVLLDVLDELLLRTNNVSSNTLRVQHSRVKRLEKEIEKCQEALATGEMPKRKKKKKGESDFMTLEEVQKELEKAVNKLPLEQRRHDKLQELLLDIKASKWALFGLEEQAVCDRNLRETFDLPPTVRNRANQEVIATYRKNKQDIFSGRKSLELYKNKSGIPVVKTSIRWIDSEHFCYQVSKDEEIYFKIYYGRDRQGAQNVVEQIVKGDLEWSAPTFIVEDSKMFISVPCKRVKEERYLNPDKALGVDLGIVVPAYLSTPDEAAYVDCCPEHTDKKMIRKMDKEMRKEFRRPLGNVLGLFEKKRQFCAQRKRIQASIGLCSGGRGRKRLRRPVVDLKAHERTWTKKIYEKLSCKIIDAAIQQGCGVIRLEYLSGMSKEEKEYMGVRYWSPALLISLIRRRAEKVDGLEVIEVDPSFTSQRCSVCGYIHEDNRQSQEKFKCVRCGVELNADWNAARNIAVWARPVKGSNFSSLHIIRKKHLEGRSLKAAEKELLEDNGLWVDEDVEVKVS